MLSLILTLLPIAVILCMLTIFKKPADISGIVGWLAISLVSWFFFNTSLEVLMRSTAAGFIRSFAVSLIVAASRTARPPSSRTLMAEWWPSSGCSEAS